MCCGLVPRGVENSLIHCVRWRSFQTDKDVLADHEAYDHLTELVKRDDESQRGVF